MKHRFFRKGLFALPILAAALALGGCMTDRFDDACIPDTGGNDGVTISVSIPASQVPNATRSIADGNGEAAVKSVDVLVFKAGTPAGTPDVLVQHAKGQSLTQSTSSTDSYLVKFTARLTTDATAVRVVLVANASDETDAAVAAAGGAGTALKTNILSNLKHTSAGKWNAASSSDHTPIPMYGEKAVSGIAARMKIDNVDLVRMAARVDVVNAAAGFTLSDVYLVNRNSSGYAAPAWNASNGTLTGVLPAVPTVPSGSQKTGQAQALAYTYVAGGLSGEIYTYEAAAASGVEGNATHTDAVCLILKGTYGGKTYYYRADFTEGKDGAGKAPGDAGFNPATVKYMPVYRNHRYVFTIGAVRGIGYAAFDDALRSLGIMNNLRTSLLVVDESGIKNFVFNGQHYLGAGGDAEFDKVAGAAANVAVTTNYAYGWQIDASKGTGGIEYLSGSGWLSAVKDGAASLLSAGLTVTALSANSGDDRAAYVHLIAGRLTAKVKVTQAGGPPAVDPAEITDEGNEKRIITYVGAFWRAAQTGERIITLPISYEEHAGKWVVQVLAYGEGFSEGDIVFLAGGSDDPTIYGSTPGDAESFQVNSTAVLATGTVANGGEIKFRIGLKSVWNSSNPAWTAGHPVRYAKIVVSFGTHLGRSYHYNRVIWLRQGEEADYVMRPGDPTPAGTVLANRTAAYARKFIPYNLTAPSSDPLTDADDYKSLALRGGAWTQYPSQAGAMFQWAHSVAGYERRAWHPIKSVAAWNTNNISSWAWNSSKHETCPTGYRRPMGSGTSANTTSEHGMSLMADPSTNNSNNAVKGYYADGFFDRREITVSSHSPATDKTTVADDTCQVAYMGTLFYNPIFASESYCASIFFSYNGTRSTSLVSAGTNGGYLTSVKAGTTTAYSLEFTYGMGMAYSSNAGIYASSPIRCVAE